MTQDEEPFLEDRWIMLRADVCATGLWSSEGFPVDPEELPIAPDLVARITAWQAWYDAVDDAMNTHSTPWEILPGAPVAAFNAAGRALAHALKAELPPEWTVVAEDADAWFRRRAEPLEHWLLELPGRTSD